VSALRTKSRRAAMATLLTSRMRPRTSAVV
jgi:hypothetical protein